MSDALYNSLIAYETKKWISTKLKVDETDVFWQKGRRTKTTPDKTFQTPDKTPSQKPSWT